jgi:hypothetical protein
MLWLARPGMPTPGCRSVTGMMGEGKGEESSVSPISYTWTENGERGFPKENTQECERRLQQQKQVKTACSPLVKPLISSTSSPHNR